MAHKLIPNGKVVLDWTAGDPEGDRKYLFQAYTDFLNEVLDQASEHSESNVLKVFEKWQVTTENQVDDFPRIWIERPKE